MLNGFWVDSVWILHGFGIDSVWILDLDILDGFRVDSWWDLGAKCVVLHNVLPGSECGGWILCGF